MRPSASQTHFCLPQLDLKTYTGTIEYTETEEEEKNVKVLDLVKAGEIAFSTILPQSYTPFSAQHMPTSAPVCIPVIVA